MSPDDDQSHDLEPPADDWDPGPRLLGYDAWKLATPLEYSRDDGRAYRVRGEQRPVVDVWAFLFGNRGR